MNIKKITQVLWFYYIYLVLVGFYVMTLTTKFLEYLDISSTLFTLLVFYLPLPMAAYVAFRTKTVFKKATPSLVFVFSWLIGLAPGILLGYGLYSLSHSIYSIDLIKSILFFGLLYSVITGIAGIVLISLYNIISRLLKKP